MSRRAMVRQMVGSMLSELYSTFEQVTNPETQYGICSGWMCATSSREEARKAVLGGLKMLMLQKLVNINAWVETNVSSCISTAQTT